ncbi:MAG: hypothetical protein PHQ61_08565, partial [Candidatus Omnitrophica bacterium]|nr:hypothetical protein [Candidatus Omnitrophota bacterium]
TVDRRTRPDSSVTRKAESTLGELGAKGVTRDQVNGAVSEYSRLRATGNERSAVASWSGFLMKSLSGDSASPAMDADTGTGTRMQDILSAIQSVNANALNGELDDFDSIASEENYDRQLGMLMAMTPEIGLNESRKISGWMNIQTEIGDQTGEGFSVRMSLGEALDLAVTDDPLAGSAHIAEEIKSGIESGNGKLSGYEPVADTVLASAKGYNELLRSRTALDSQTDTLTRSGRASAEKAINAQVDELNARIDSALNDIGSLREGTGLSDASMATMLTGDAVDRSDLEDVASFAGRMEQDYIAQRSRKMDMSEMVRTSLNMPLNSVGTNRTGLDLISSVIDRLGLTGQVSQEDIARIHYNQSRVIDAVINNANSEFAGKKGLFEAAAELRGSLAEKSGKLTRDQIRQFSEESGIDVEDVYDLMGLNNDTLREAYHSVTEPRAEDTLSSSSVSREDIKYVNSLIGSFSDANGELARIQAALGEQLGGMMPSLGREGAERTTEKRRPATRRGAADTVVTSAMIASAVVVLSGTGMIGISLPVAVAFGAIAMTIPLALSRGAENNAAGAQGRGDRTAYTAQDKAGALKESFDMKIDGTGVRVGITPDGLTIDMKDDANGTRRQVRIKAGNVTGGQGRELAEKVARKAASQEAFRAKQLSSSGISQVMEAIGAIRGEIGQDDFRSFEVSFDDFRIKVLAQNNGTLVTELTHNATGSILSIDTHDAEALAKAQEAMEGMDRVSQTRSGVSEFNEKIAPALGSIRDHIAAMALTLENGDLSIKTSGVSPDMVTVERYSGGKVSSSMRTELTENSSISDVAGRLMDPVSNIRDHSDLGRVYGSIIGPSSARSGALSINMGITRVDMDLNANTVNITNIMTSAKTGTCDIDQAFSEGGMVASMIEAEKVIREARSEIANGNVPVGHTVVIEDRQGNKYELRRGTGSKIDITKNGTEMAGSDTPNLVESLSEVMDKDEAGFMRSVIDTELSGRLPIEQRWMVMVDGEVRISDKSSIYFGKTGIKFGSSMTRRRGDTARVLYESHTHPHSARPDEYADSFRADLAERLVVAIHEDMAASDVAPMEVNEVDKSGNVIRHLSVGFRRNEGILSVYSADGTLLGEEVIMGDFEVMSLREELSGEYAARQEARGDIAIENENGERFIIARILGPGEIELVSEHIAGRTETGRRSMDAREGTYVTRRERPRDLTAPAEDTYTDSQGAGATETGGRLYGPRSMALDIFGATDGKTLAKKLSVLKSEDISAFLMERSGDAAEAIEAIGAVRREIDRVRTDRDVPDVDAVRILEELRGAEYTISRLGESEDVYGGTDVVSTVGDLAGAVRERIDVTTRYSVADEGTDDSSVGADEYGVVDITVLSYDVESAKASASSLSGTDELRAMDKNNVLVVSAYVLEHDPNGLKSLAADLSRRNALNGETKQRILIIAEDPTTTTGIINGWDDIADIFTVITQDGLAGEIADMKRTKASVETSITGVLTGKESFFEAVIRECDSYIIAGEDFTFGMALALALTRANYVAFAGITDEGIERLREIARKEGSSNTGRHVIRLQSAGSTTADEAIDEALFADLKADTAF